MHHVHDHPKTEFHFMIDADNNAATGGSPAAIAGQVPTHFAGAEYVGTVRLRGLEVFEATLLEYQPQEDVFVAVDGVFGLRERVDAIPDFPMGRRGGEAIAPVENLPMQEIITLSEPNSLVALSTGSSFRVEFLSVDVESEATDHARTPGMGFDLPVFPRCQPIPDSVTQGGSAAVSASGLLPSRDVHMFLGAVEVGDGMTDSNGNVTLTLDVPGDAQIGLRLVTIGSNAVTADCSITVEERNGDVNADLDDNDNCCTLLIWQLWIIIALMVIAIALLWLRWHQGRLTATVARPTSDE